MEMQLRPVVFFSLYLFVRGSFSQEAAVMLKRSLLTNYDKSLRPVKNFSSPVNVDFDISLRQIIELAEKQQTFRINIWLRLYWDDEFLRWNASDHEDVDTLTIHSDDIWRPDIFLYNNIGESYGNIDPITDVTVTSSGRVSYLQPTIFTSACPVDVVRFPFDTQDCELEFGSWVYSGAKLNLSLVNPSADLASYTRNGEYDLTSAPLSRKVTYYTCCPEPYVAIIFNLRLSRLSFFYMFNMVQPCIVLMILNVFGFYIPPDSGERLGFFMTILLALVVFLQVLSDFLPATSLTAPLLGQFFAATIILVGFSCLATIVVMRMSYDSPPHRPLPRWARLVLLRYMARLFCMSSISELTHTLSGTKPNAVQPTKLVTGEKVGLPKTDHLREILRYIRDFEQQARAVKDHVSERDEWKMAALVLDRALLIAVGIATILVCSILLHH